MIGLGFIRNRSALNIDCEHRISEKPEGSGFSFYAMRENTDPPVTKAKEQTQLQRSLSIHYHFYRVNG
jgi:hypothetical protein